MFPPRPTAHLVAAWAAFLGVSCTPAADGYPRRAGATLPRCVDTEPPRTRDLAEVPSTLVGTIRPLVERTEDIEGEHDPSTETGELFYAQTRGYGWYAAAGGEPRRLLTDLGGDAPPAATRRTLLWMAVLSDVQLADDESPLRAAAGDSEEVRYLLRPQEAYVPRILSAMNRTLAAVEARTRPFDAGIVTGDCTDSAQLDELDWFMSIMDGATVHPDSGADDDPVPHEEDPKDPFHAHPFPAPWLYVPGNHDTLPRGDSPMSADLQSMSIGDFAPRGTRDYSRWFAPVTVGHVPRDERRALLTRDRIAARVRAGAVAPGPPGHGLGMSGSALSYAYDVVPGLVRILTLDTNDDTGGTNGIVRRATVDDFLLPELTRARDEGVLVLLASHHALDKIDRHEGDEGPEIPEAVAPAELEALVAAHPHVIAWLVGHSHEHRVVARGHSDATRGYWEIMTSGLADAPAQSRVLEILEDGNGVVSILATVVDYAEQGCLERRARRLMFLDFQAGWASEAGWGQLEDRNVELRVPLPDDLAAAVSAAAATRPVGPVSDALGIR